MGRRPMAPQLRARLCRRKKGNCGVVKSPSDTHGQLHVCFAHPQCLHARREIITAVSSGYIMAASGDLGLFASRANSCAIVAFDIGSEFYFVALACRVSAAPMRELGPGIFFYDFDHRGGNPQMNFSCACLTDLTQWCDLQQSENSVLPLQ